MKLKCLFFNLLFFFFAACSPPVSAPTVEAINARINAEPYVAPGHICRDYVQEKIEALRASGARDDDMRVAYGYTLDDPPIQHVVLVYQRYGEFMSLDNRSNVITPEPDIEVAMKLRTDSAAWRQILRNPRTDGK